MEEVVAYATAVFREAEVVPFLAPDVEHLWVWFTEVFNPGGVGMGPYRTHFTEIEAYARMTRIKIEPWEALALRAMAEAYVIVNHEKTNKDKPNKGAVIDKDKVTGLPPGKKLTKLIPMSDSKGLLEMFRGMGRNKPMPKPPAKPD